MQAWEIAGTQTPCIKKTKNGKQMSLEKRKNLCKKIYYTEASFFPSNFSVF